MKRALALLALSLPGLASAQLPRTGRGNAIVDSVLARPHVIRSGTGPLLLPRDSTVTTSLIVLGRPTYLASRVQGDVVVVGADLFLRPGAEVSGRAVSIGGAVMETTLGRVGGDVESLRGAGASVASDGVVFVHEATEAPPDEQKTPLFQLGGIYGLSIPRYDRVDGLSLPLVGIVTLGALELAPSVTYRSRLGKWDPGLAVLAGDTAGVHFLGRAARDTRTNEGWINSTLVNSLKTLGWGSDARNYFRSDIGEGRLFVHVPRGADVVFEPYIGARYEKVSPISNTGDVFSFIARSDTERIKRPNPLVEPGNLGSGLLGVLFRQEGPVVTSAASLEAEQAFTAPAGTKKFLQLTFDGRVEFPTFGLQRLRFRAHAVGTSGDSVPMARYHYLGGSGTLALSEMLELGGDRLAFVESRYSIPFERVLLPVVGSPTVTLRHLVGGAGVGSLGALQQEVGLTLGLGPLELEVTTGASGRHGTKFGVDLAVPKF
jgi:hypothetical protein